MEWQSLTFVGERHQLQLRIDGTDAAEIAGRITAGLEDAEFSIRGHIVADISCTTDPDAQSGGIMLRIEALTIED